MKSFLTLISAAMLSISLFTSSPVEAKRLQCVPYARALSGVDLFGNAKTWWAQAAGRYERGNSPREGAVLTLPGHGRMHNGHVAVVSKILNSREILLNHANWSWRGGIERNVKAVDVSANGDWSRVRIWHAGSGDLGITSYPAFGFIYKN